MLDEGKDLRTVLLTPRQDDQGMMASSGLDKPLVVAVLFPRTCFSTAKAFWQHTGNGISSRRAEDFLEAFKNGHLKCTKWSFGVHSFQEVESAEFQSPHSSIANKAPSLAARNMCKGPQRYQKQVPQSGLHAVPDLESGQLPQEANSVDVKDHVRFIEERFGRNLDSRLASKAKIAIRRRIAGALIADSDLDEALDKLEVTGHERNVSEFSVDDVYLYPSGMSSIFNTHRTLMKCRGSLKSICFGFVHSIGCFSASTNNNCRFPYIDTLKILEKWGPGCLFYGHGSNAEIDDLEERCSSGERFLALFCEFPGNPLLKSPDLSRLRSLADQYDFAIVVDETIGNFLNVDVLPFADVIVSSLTKVFSGDSNVMGGR